MTWNAKIDFWRPFPVFALLLFLASGECAKQPPFAARGPRGVGGKRSILKGHRVDATPEREAEPVPASVREQATPPPVSIQDPHRHRSCETTENPHSRYLRLAADVVASHPDHGSSKGANFAGVEIPQCNAAPPCTQDGIRYRMELCPEELEFLAAFRGVG